ncbi:metallophosphoesterase [uncultured Maritimibacter sp.]|uniref:metallophosphoesterase n=1 Tax=uncultured Maritimibacter sp. TaxID=991866 RepID=UPI002637419F|nr:metallophosphoesterase [uncultured Maritimibacter sp.]
MIRRFLGGQLSGGRVDGHGQGLQPAPEPERKPFSAPIRPDEPLAIIGDVHGCSTLFDRLLAKLDREAPDARRIVVGDLVDRGENSRAVLERVFGLSQEDPAFVALPGNHEEMMFDFLDHREGPRSPWLRYGGLQTCASFGIPGLRETSSPKDREAGAKALRDALGPIEPWLRAVPLMFRSGNIAVVHAGVSPNRPLDQQKRDALLWGHPQFQTHDRTDGQWVVHGHTIVPVVEPHRGRIGVDTGAYATGILSAAVLRPDGTCTTVSVSGAG